MCYMRKSSNLYHIVIEHNTEEHYLTEYRNLKSYDILLNKMSFVVQSKEIICETQKSPYPTSLPVTDSDTEKYFVYYILDGDNIIAYAIIDSQPNIYGLYKLHAIEVDKQHRKKGVGSYLVNHLVQIYKEIYLDSVSESVGFWIKTGAKLLIKKFGIQVFLFSQRSTDDVRSLIFDL